jgi:hypothetical protein
MSREELAAKYGEVLTTSEATQDYAFKSFLAPVAFVTRKSDGVSGTLEFQHDPRFYFNFTPRS